VIDLLGEGMHAIAMRSVLAYPFVFAAGAATGIGPCAAPRYVAVAALAGATSRPWTVLAPFGAGLAGAYAVLGLATGTLAALWSASRAVYLALAIGLAVSALATLMRDGARSHGACTTRRAAAPARASTGGVFLLGASSAFVVAPCCTPAIAAIAGLTVTSGHVADGAALLAAFGCGHALPVLATGALASRLTMIVRRLDAAGATAVVGGGLMLALAAYYGILA
jgi:cytochrome c biogenesis protein CcdA